MVTILDLRGLSCPIPLVRTKQALDTLDCVQVVVDEPTPKENILKYAHSQKFLSECEQCGDEYRITIRKE
jgi:TusA-related sulfurtransferase